MACTAALPAHAETYPSRPIRFVVPFPAAGASDVLSRALAEKLTASLGQSVVIENRPGAGSTIGADFAAKAPPDGYTLLIITGSLPIAANLYRKLGFDLLKSFTPISLVANVPHVLVVNPSVPAKSVKELIALAKSRPGQLSAASQGNGTLSHLELELLKTTAGIDMAHIPYKGSSNAMTDLLAGNVSVFFDSVASSMPFVKKGQLRALAVVSPTRLPMSPDIPTFAEAGLPGFEARNWFAVVAPAGTPPDIVNLLNAHIAKAVAAPDMVQRMAAQGAIMEASSPEQVTALIKSDLAKWGKVIRDANLHMD
ncbi:Bug family tripartite tricarboxylate transporter substrate binding protein [Cupriavidus sp. H19C3]|uniref:Bug family tripartite tricarboxylate transporter substrate binding protein n=1 Tax=Cupriavidus sp. H19C3 TaxID=3241603 RepID=UPI003BF7CABD